MKICLVTHTFPRFPGDKISSIFMHGVATGLAHAGNEVIVVAPFSPLYPTSPASNLPYKIVTYKYVWPASLHTLGYSNVLVNDKSLKLSSWILSPFLYFFGFFALLKLVTKEKIDLISAHWILPNGFIACLVSLITKTPVVTTLPGSDVYMVAKNPLFRALGTFAAHHSSKITSNSPQLLADIQHLTGVNPAKCYTILYGVDPAILTPNPARGQAYRRQLGISPKVAVILCLSRFVAKKGHTYLIAAAPQIVSRFPTALFVLAGNGDLEPSLKKQVASLGLTNNFIFTGPIKNQNLIDIYNMCDVFVLPSIRDANGNLDDQSLVVVDAMACGKPVITTSFPGYSLVVESGKNGYLLPPEQVDELAQAIIKLLASPRLRTAFGRHSRQLVTTRLSIDYIGSQYTTLFVSLVGHA